LTRLTLSFAGKSPRQSRALRYFANVLELQGRLRSIPSKGIQSSEEFHVFKTQDYYSPIFGKIPARGVTLKIYVYIFGFLVTPWIKKERIFHVLHLFFIPFCFFRIFKKFNI
jgi:hypothetical protein